MSASRVIFLTLIAMIAFAGNSLLCRAALLNTAIDAASFTTIRLFSGALMLWFIIGLRHKHVAATGNWLSAFALFIYAAGFSYAYISLSTATGALLLFAAVQTSMIGYGVYCGERLHPSQLSGLVLAFVGLAVLLMPGLTAPPLYGALLMLAAGLAWGIYSLRGKTAGTPILVTTGNFLRATVLATLVSMLTVNDLSFDIRGAVFAVLSGALASGLGYAIWYTVLPWLKATNAASVQLSVPVIAAFGGSLLLGEPISLRLVLASLAIIGGIALVVTYRGRDSHKD